MPLSEIKGSSKTELVKKLIEKLTKEGKPIKQAIAIALHEARSRGFDASVQVPSMGLYTEDGQPELGNPQTLTGNKTNILRIPVVLVKEMVQLYHRTEIPFFDEILPPEITTVPVLKSYPELKDMVSRLHKNGSDNAWIPFVSPHTEGIFLKDQYPFKEPESSFVKPEEVRGKIKEIVADDKRKLVKGFAYIDMTKCKEFADKIKSKIVDVSIGFSAYFDFDPGELDNKEYWLVQKDMYLGHLAGLPNAKGKCPSGQCGLNMDVQKSSSNEPIQKGSSLPNPIKGQFLGYLPQTTSHTYITKYQSPTKNPVSLDKAFKYSFSTSSHRGTTMEPDELIAKLQAQLAEKDTQLDSLKNSASEKRIKDAETKLEELKIQLATLNSSVSNKDSEIEKLKKDVADAESKYKKFEDAEKATLLTKLETVMPNWVMDGKHLKDLCLAGLKNAEATYNALATKTIKDSGMPKPANVGNPNANQGKFASTIIDMNQLYNDANKKGDK